MPEQHRQIVDIEDLVRDRGLANLAKTLAHEAEVARLKSLARERRRTKAWLFIWRVCLVLLGYAVINWLLHVIDLI